MNYKQALRRIKPESCKGDEDALLGRIYEPWPGMEKDLEIGHTILRRHALRSGPTGIPLAGKLDHDGKSFTVADWIMEIIEKFVDEYPDEDERQFRTMKTLSAIQNELIPPEPH